MKEDLEFLESYLITEYDAEFVWGKKEKNAYYYDVNCISINTTRSKEIQLFCLLHEAGHLIIRKTENFSNEYPHTHKDGKTQLSRVDIIREEIKAWEEGREFARRLFIEIDDYRWSRYWKRQVYKYIRWAVDKEQ